MKVKIQHIIVTILTLSVCLSCSKDHPDYTNGSGSESEKTIGYLSLEKLNVIASSDLTENFEDKAGGRGRARAQSSLDAFLIEITNEDNKVVYSSTYKEISDLTENIKLEIGVYTLKASSTDSVPLVAWETPTFYGERSFVINKNQTTTVDNLVCEVSNIKTTLELSADLKEFFKADDVANVPMTVDFKLGESIVQYTRNETRPAFFKAINDNNTIEITLNGEYNTASADQAPNYEEISWSQTITNVKAGQWRKVKIKIDNADAGNVQFVIEVESWTYDEEIDVPVVRFFSLARYEEEIEDPYDRTTDPGSAVITLGGGYTIGSPINVDKTIFIAETNVCIKPPFIYATPAADATVVRMEIFDIESDSTNIVDAFGGEKVQLFPTNEQSAYSVVSEDENGKIKIVATNAGMLKLYNYAGKHTVIIKTLDSKGRKSFTELTINVSADAIPSTGPNVTWRGGKQFGTLYNVSDLTDLIIDIESTTGITKFVVNILGDVVDEATLLSVGLGRELDLIDPGDMEDPLVALSFPVKDGVENQTKLTFDITNFLAMLNMLVTETGEVIFSLNIGDASGDDTYEIKLNVVKE